MALVKTLLNGNEVEYDDTEFEIAKDNGPYGVSYLHYVGTGGVVKNPKGNTSCYKMFSGLDASNFDTSCKKVKVLDLSNFDTSNVTEMISMFSGCSSLVELNLQGFVTSNVSDMAGMFFDCSSLVELNLQGFVTNNVSDMGCMFCGCKSLKHLDLSGFDTSNVEDMEDMFSYCSSLKELDLSNFNTHNVTEMHDMFCGCKSLTKLDVSNFDTSKVTDMGSMFEGCESLSTLDLSNFDTSNVTDMFCMFLGCKSLKGLDLSNFVTAQVKSTSLMFKNCQSLVSLNLSSFDSTGFVSPPESYEWMEEMFDGCTSLSSLDLSSLSKFIIVPAFQKCNNLKDIVFKRLDIMSYSTEDLKIIFKDCSYLDKLLNNKLVENMVADLLSQDEKAVLKKYRGKGIKDHYFVSVLSTVKPESMMIDDYCDKVIIPNINKLFQKSNGSSSLTVGDVFKKLSTVYGRNLSSVALTKFLSDEYLVD